MKNIKVLPNSEILRRCEGALNFIESCPEKLFKEVGMGLMESLRYGDTDRSLGSARNQSSSEAQKSIESKHQKCQEITATADKGRTVYEKSKKQLRISFISSIPSCFIQNNKLSNIKTHSTSFHFTSPKVYKIFKKNQTLLPKYKKTASHLFHLFHSLLLHSK
jgi:hypothetical protein